MKILTICFLATSLFFGQRQIAFNAYWYSGKAEMNSYNLDQYRYNNHYKGEAVLIFVTEDFLKEKQVKYEYGDKSKSDIIIKLNRQRRFYTGVYPYTMMTSIFRPIWGEKPYKLTHSSQDWCGQTYIQLNLKDDKYKSELRSYFQKEGDVNKQIEANLLEDDLFIMIRLDDNRIPKGNQRVIPSAVSTRFMHIPLEPYEAEISILEKQTFKSSDHLKTLLVRYRDLSRILKIHYETGFPHKIIGWEETINGKTTTAYLKKSLQLDYWSKNNPSDNKFKNELQLD